MSVGSVEPRRLRKRKTNPYPTSLARQQSLGYSYMHICSKENKNNGSSVSVRRGAQITMVCLVEPAIDVLSKGVGSRLSSLKGV